MYKKQYNILDKLNKLINEKFNITDINISHENLLSNINTFIYNKNEICKKLLTIVKMFNTSFDSFYDIEKVVSKFICELNTLNEQYEEELSKYNDLKNELNHLTNDGIKEYWGMMIFSQNVIFDRKLFEKVVRYEIITREIEYMSNNKNNTENKINDIKLRLKFYAEIKNIVYTNTKIKKKIEELVNKLNNLNIEMYKNKKDIDSDIDNLCDDLQKLIKISYTDNINKMIKLCDNFEGMNLLS